MNVYVGKEVHFHSFLSLAIDEGEWSGFSPRPLHPRGKIPQYSFNKRLGRPQNRSEHFGEEKKSLAPVLRQTTILCKTFKLRPFPPSKLSCTQKLETAPYIVL